MQSELIPAPRLDEFSVFVEFHDSGVAGSRPAAGVPVAPYAVIETARQWAGRGQRVRGHVVKVRPGEAGHRIVREAIEARSDAIVMPMPQRRPSGKTLNRTLEIVLAKRPCRVIIDSAPAYPLITKEAATTAA